MGYFQTLNKDIVLIKEGFFSKKGDVTPIDKVNNIRDFRISLSINGNLEINDKINYDIIKWFDNIFDNLPTNIGTHGSKLTYKK